MTKFDHYALGAETFANFADFGHFRESLTREKLCFGPSLCSQNFSRFSFFFKPFFYFFLTSFFHQNPLWFLRRFAVPKVDYLLREFIFAKLDFFYFTCSFILAHSTKL